MKKEVKAQATLETILVLSLVITILLFIVEVDQTILTNTEHDYTLKKMQFAMDSIVHAADLVYQQGEGARIKIRLTLPAHISSFSIGHRMINATINTSGTLTTIFRKFDYDITGSLPTEQGYYWFLLESRQGGVNISLYNNTFS